MLPTPMLAIADPGHCPEMPQPTPNIAAPIIVFLFSVRFLFLNSPPSNGFFNSFGTRLIVSAVTKADPPRSKSNPRSLSCKKLRTTSCFAMPPKAKPKPKSKPPVKTKKCLVLKALPPELGTPSLCLFQQLEMLRPHTKK